MSKNLALIIDDDPGTVEILRLAVETVLGCEVVSAANGQIGLFEAEKHRPDFILLDWIMPEMSGLETLDELKLDADTAPIPVYMITQKTGFQDIKRAMNIGAAGYFKKPVDFDGFCQWLTTRFPELADSATGVS